MDKGEITSAEKGNHFHRYFNYAISLLESYDGKEPFHLYLKKYFSTHKKHGSKDRRIITSLCYDYFRLGVGVTSDLDLSEKILLATFLFDNGPSKLAESRNSLGNESRNFEIISKLDSVKKVFNAENIFPFNEELSKEIDIKKFNLSFLIQPKLFVRIRPGKEKVVFNKLNTANVYFENLSQDCLAFSNNEKVSNVLSIDKEVVIQDFNSQRTEDLFKDQLQAQLKMSLWDCCAASGGKSILAHDLFKNIELTVSDTRKSILHNLKLRFQKAGITNYTSFVADLSVPKPFKELKKSFDVIIADVPCSGSGTWARTPEQLSFFDKKQIEEYANLQQKVVINSVPYLTQEGLFLYITCSVFRKENEENVLFIQEQTGLQLIRSEYLKGYEILADTLFVALFRKDTK
jgi:16S rRNA (cytosine967-C5)-methyltransferase